MKTLFIINKKSGRNSSRYWSKIEYQVTPLLQEYEVVVADKPEDIVKETIRGIEESYDFITSVGGDGTTGLIASTILSNRKGSKELGPILSCLPAGTGCDFYKGISKGASPATLLEQGTTKNLDVIKVTLDGDREFYGINSVSIGYSAEVVRLREGQSSLVPEMLSYFLPGVLALKTWNSEAMTFKTDDQEISRKLLLALFMKGTYAGGGMKLGPDMGDLKGKMLVTLVPPITTGILLRHSVDLFTKGIQSNPIVDVLHSKTISCEGKQPINLEVDGELHSCTKFKLEVIPETLPCLVME